MDPNDTIRYRLSAEDCLMHWMERGFEGHDVILQTGTRFGTPQMILEAEGHGTIPTRWKTKISGLTAAACWSA